MKGLPLAALHLSGIGGVYCAWACALRRLVLMQMSTCSVWQTTQLSCWEKLLLMWLWTPTAFFMLLGWISKSWWRKFKKRTSPANKPVNSPQMLHHKISAPLLLLAAWNNFPFPLWNRRGRKTNVLKQGHVFMRNDKSVNKIKKSYNSGHCVFILKAWPHRSNYSKTKAKSVTSPQETGTANIARWVFTERCRGCSVF